MTHNNAPIQHEEIDHLLTTFINTYHASFPTGQPFPWIELWAEEVEWTLPRPRMPHHVRPGKDGIADWAKETIGSFLRDRKFVEKRRIIQGHVVAWEGTWEDGNTPTGEPATLPLVMVIEFNREGKVKSLYSYYDSVHFQ